MEGQQQQEEEEAPAVGDAPDAAPADAGDAPSPTKKSLSASEQQKRNRELFGDSSDESDSDAEISKPASTAAEPPLASKKKEQQQQQQQKKKPEYASIPGLSSSSEDSDDSGLSSSSESEDESAGRGRGKKRVLKRSAPAAKRKKAGKQKGAAATKRGKAAASGGKGKKRQRDGREVIKKKRKEGDDAGDDPTREDNDFIDDSDDDKELLAEYAGEPRPPGSDSEAEEDNTEKEKTEESVMDGVLKVLRRRKSQELTQTQRETIAQQFLLAMDKAAMQDEVSVEMGRRALRKLKLLKYVQKTLTKHDLMEALLEFDMLSVLKRWIQPYESGSLPNITVRASLLEILKGLPVQMDHLKRSGVGKVLIALLKHPDETEDNKRLIKEIVDKWNRPIFQKEMNYRALSMMRRHNESLRGGDQARAPIRRQNSNSNAGAEVLPDLLKQDHDVIRDSQQSSQRVRIPMSQGLAFQHAPASRVDPEQRARARANVAASGSRAVIHKHLTKKGGK